jgi:hypothetical protein
MVPTTVIACDKREAFAQGSESDEAIHLSGMPRYGLLRCARNDGAGIRARLTPPSLESINPSRRILGAWFPALA